MRDVRYETDMKDVRNMRDTRDTKKNVTNVINLKNMRDIRDVRERMSWMMRWIIYLFSHQKYEQGSSVRLQSSHIKQ